MSRIPGLIIKSISHMKMKQKSLDRSTDLKGENSVSFFFLYVFVCDGPIYLDIAEIPTI